MSLNLTFPNVVTVFSANSASSMSSDLLSLSDIASNDPICHSIQKPCHQGIIEKKNMDIQRAIGAMIKKICKGRINLFTSGEENSTIQYLQCRAFPTHLPLQKKGDRERRKPRIYYPAEGDKRTLWLPRVSIPDLINSSTSVKSCVLTSPSSRDHS